MSNFYMTTHFYIAILKSQRIDIEARGLVVEGRNEAKFLSRLASVYVASKATNSAFMVLPAIIDSFEDCHVMTLPRNINTCCHWNHIPN